MLLGDFNDDGFDDLVVSTPEADVVSMTDNGRVTVYYGSATGLSDLPDVILAGASDGAHYGAGMDTGAAMHWDANKDGLVCIPWENGEMHVVLTIYGVSLNVDNVGDEED